jgi:hypothetical protein
MIQNRCIAICSLDSSVVQKKRPDTLISNVATNIQDSEVLKQSADQ